ncbi:MAG TPA: cupin-like domain-containing protein, partial [Rheinheimera sp.]|nr:cupin-like domain-containing protein [Rheinheimera sp.]
VEGLMSFNILINYWWSTAPRYTGSGMNLLYHALLCLRDKPEHERKAWQAVLNHYIFDDPKKAGQHLPEQARGVLGELDEMQARQLRAMLLNRLNR